MGMRSIAKRTVFNLLVYGGGYSLWRFIKRRNINVLMIHSVMDQGIDSSWKPSRAQLSRRHLDRVLSLLASRYNFISLDEAVDILSGRRPSVPNAMVVTFDDGYRNNLEYALPIVERHGITPVFYVCSGHIEERKPFWFDRLDYAISQLSPGCYDVEVGGRNLKLDTRSPGVLESSFRAIRRALKDAVRDDAEMIAEIDRISSGFEKISGKRLADIFEHDPWSAIMTWDEVRQASERGVTIGSHTIDHVRISAVEEEVAMRELVESKKAIEHHVGKPCLHFCYPNGDHDQRSVELVRKAGYHSAVLAEEGPNLPGMDVMRIHRVNFPTNESQSDAEILVKISGLATALFSLKDRLLGR